VVKSCLFLFVIGGVGRKGKEGPCAPTSQANEKSVAAHGGDLGSWGILLYIYAGTIVRYRLTLSFQCCVSG